MVGLLIGHLKDPWIERDEPVSIAFDKPVRIECLEDLDTGSRDGAGAWSVCCHAEPYARVATRGGAFRYAGAMPPNEALRSPDDRSLALRVVSMPRDTNPNGTIFGGVILSYVDQAAMVAALRHAHCVWVTASMQRVDFIAPVFLGDIVELYTHTARIGKKSVTICVEVDALRHNTGEPIQVTTATVTMVSLDRSGRPVAFVDAPPPESYPTRFETGAC